MFLFPPTASHAVFVTTGYSLELNPPKLTVWSAKTVSPPLLSMRLSLYSSQTSLWMVFVLIPPVIILAAVLGITKNAGRWPVLVTENFRGTAYLFLFNMIWPAGIISTA